MNEEFEKCFYEEHTGTFHETIAAAKRAAKAKGYMFPMVSRVWIKNAVIFGSATVFAYGESCSSIKYADEYIAEKLNRS